MSEIASIVFAAGKGTRMTGYAGNKTLLPLIPGDNLFTGKRPLVRQVLDNLPAGPKAIVLNHCADEVGRATEGPGISHVRQTETNGTGGALLAARDFLQSTEADRVIITMGDVPLIRPGSYSRLIQMLTTCCLALLAFQPANRAQYGMIETKDDHVVGIVEWKYWKEYSAEKQQQLRYCNAGVYAARRDVLLKYLDTLERHPHEVIKERNGKLTPIKEYFLTDLVEMMHKDGLQVGMTLAPEEEVIGVDTPESLEAVQKLFRQMQH